MFMPRVGQHKCANLNPQNCLNKKHIAYHGLLLLAMMFILWDFRTEKKMLIDCGQMIVLENSWQGKILSCSGLSQELTLQGNWAQPKTCWSWVVPMPLAPLSELAMAKQTAPPWHQGTKHPSPCPMQSHFRAFAVVFASDLLSKMKPSVECSPLSSTSFPEFVPEHLHFKDKKPYPGLISLLQHHPNASLTS